jgi:SAM-dependent methyltransferase
MMSTSKTELSRSQRRFVQSLLKFVSGSKMVLDAGCGSGWLGAALKQELSATVVSVDIHALRTCRGVDSFAAMDIRNLGFTEAFDLIIAKDVIEHLPNPEKAMEQLSKSLKEGGKIIVNVPSPDAPYLWDDYTHVRPYTKESMIHLLSDSGFEAIDMKYLAAPTPGAAIFKLKGILDSLANKGLRRGDLIAVARKKSNNVFSTGISGAKNSTTI